MSFDWPVDRSGYPALPAVDAEDYAVKVAEQRGAEALAITVLWALSARQFGLATQVVRPCPSRLDSAHHYGGGGVTSYVTSWEGYGWISVPCGCSGGCRLGGPRAVHLLGPVHSVTEVNVEGLVVPTNSYTLEGGVLYRRIGPWPRQDLGRPLGEPGTWAVTYRRGIEVPFGVDQLTGILAAQFLAAVADGEGRCRLPRTVTTASRNGVTYRAYDPAVIYANGKTGLAEVDLWLAAVNPNALAAAPSVV